MGIAEAAARLTKSGLVAEVALCLALGACGSAVEPSAIASAANPCGVPEFHGLECTIETLNDGKGADSERLACPQGADVWYLYRSGEVFHMSGRETVCHALPDGRLCDGVVCP